MAARRPCPSRLGRQRPSGSGDPGRGTTPGHWEYLARGRRGGRPLALLWKEYAPERRLTLGQRHSGHRLQTAHTPGRVLVSCWAVLKRAARIAGRHQLLWPFGFLVVFAGGSACYPHLFLLVLLASLPGRDLAGRALVGRAWALPAALALALWVVGAAAGSYLCEGALVRMVDEIERSGTTTAERGLRDAWARLAAVVRIAMAAGLPVGVLLVQLSAPAALPLLWPSTRAAALGSLCSALWPVAALVALPLAALMNLPYEFMLRRCMLEGSRPGGSIREGFHMMRHNLRRAVPMWLLLSGVGLGVGAALSLLNVLGLLAIARAASLAWALSGSAVTAALAALPCFLVWMVGSSFLLGLYMVFYSAAWTVAYRAVAEGERAAMPAPRLVLLRA